MSDTLHFYCNYVDDEIRNRRGLEGDSPAASRKILGICESLAQAGVETHIMTMGRGRAKGEASGFRAVKKTTQSGVCIRFGPMSHIRVFSQILSIVWLTWISVVNAWKRPDAVHLFYNQISFYVVPLLVLKLLRRRTMVDIEDAPVPGQQGQGYANAPTSFFAWAVNHGALTANTEISRTSNIRPVLEYYGAVQPRKDLINRDEDIGGTSRVLLSGTLSEETGAGLFVDAVNMLKKRNEPKLDVLEFHVCGFGPSLEQILALSSCTRHPKVFVHGRLDDDQYDLLLQKCSTGLSLKLSSGRYALTTFPSKTIEYVQYGLLLLATNISDITKVFQRHALYIHKDSATELADHLQWIAQHPESAKKLALAAQSELFANFNYAAAGRRLKEFMFRSFSK